MRVWPRAQTTASGRPTQVAPPHKLKHSSGSFFARHESRCSRSLFAICSSLLFSAVRAAKLACVCAGARFSDFVFAHLAAVSFHSCPSDDDPRALNVLFGTCDTRIHGCEAIRIPVPVSDIIASTCEIQECFCSSDDLTRLVSLTRCPLSPFLLVSWGRRSCLG